MRIQAINTFANNYKGNINANEKHPKPPKRKRNNITNATTTFGVWFGFGVGLDFLSRKIHFSKSPTKNSFAINGIIATLAALYTLVKIKTATTQNDKTTQ